MTRHYQRYDKESLSIIVAESTSFADVCRKLRRKPVGGTITNIKLTCDRFEIDYSHMTGQGWKKGKRDSKRKSPSELLVMGKPTDRRISADRLRKVLFEIGFEHKCNRCGITEWNGQSLVLEIDHVHGQYWNNTKENLQFLCPNCHSQKTKGL